MKKLIPLLLALAASSVQAQGNGPASRAPGKGTKVSAQSTSPDASNLSGFMEKLRMKVEKFTPQKKLGSTTAVGGIRGAEADGPEIYWKSEYKPQLIDADELAAFQKGMTLVDGNQIESAQAAFSSFLATYPDSSLKADAAEMLKQLAAK